MNAQTLKALRGKFPGEAECCVWKTFEARFAAYCIRLARNEGHSVPAAMRVFGDPWAIERAAKNAAKLAAKDKVIRCKGCVTMASDKPRTLIIIQVKGQTAVLETMGAEEARILPLIRGIVDGEQPAGIVRIHDDVAGWCDVYFSRSVRMAMAPSCGLRS